MKEGIEISYRKFLLFTAFSLFLPCIVFVVLFLAVHFGLDFGFESMGNPPEYYQWAGEMMIYLLITALLLLGLFFCLIAIHLDVISISFFIGLGRVITLRAMLETWQVVPFGSGYGNIRWTVAVLSDYYFFFLLLSLAPIGIYAAMTLLDDRLPKTELSSRYLIGLLFIGVGGYLTWMEVEKLAVYYFTNGGVATWTFGIQLGLIILFLGISLSVLGFLITHIKIEEKIKKITKLRPIFITFLFAPTGIFLVGSFIISNIYSPFPFFQDYVVRGVIYLLFIAFVLLGLLILLTAKPFDPVFVALFIGIAGSITLNALWGGLLETAKQAGVISTPFVQTGMDFAYWGLQFFFTAMTPILMYSAIKLFPEKVTFSYRYLFGLMILGVGSYIAWALLNELGIFFIWGMENLTPEIAIWFPPESWILGLPWIFWFAPLAIGLVILGFWLLKRRQKA